MKKNFLVEKSFINTRLDKWLRNNICKVPQSLIEKNIRKGKIKVNNKKTKSSYKVQKDDQISIYNLNFLPDKNKKTLNRYVASRKDLSSSSNLFIENNENFVVINKPSGISVQSGTKSRKNILDILNSTKEFDGASPYPVHRIDKDTSGILIVAKNREYAQLFTTLFRIRKIHKTYLGIVLGELKQNKGTLTDMLFYYEGLKKIQTKAVTHFRVIDSNMNYSLLQLNPVTGRKHQLRKQLLIHNHPILGDSKYRISQKYSDMKSKLMLHAYKINFSINEIKYDFTADLPSDFKKHLKEKYLRIF